jgi:hypothetical protein
LQLLEPSTRNSSLLLGPPPGQARWADRLEVAAEHLEAVLIERRQVDTEVEAMWMSAALLRVLVLSKVDGPSSLVMSLPIVVEEVEGRINTMATNGVRWGTRFTLVAALSHFLELKSELELLRFGRNADLSDDQMDALWPLVSVASDSLASLVPSSLARDPPNDAVE